MDLSKRINYYYGMDPNTKDNKNVGMYNCAEGMYRAINDKYDLNVSEDSKHIMSAFGGGLFMGDTCGLLVGGYSALAKMYASSDAPRADENLKVICREWHNRFNEHFNTVNCRDMRPNTGGCGQNARDAANIFQQLINDVGFENK